MSTASSMQKMARQTKEKQRSRYNIFTQDKNELSRSYCKKFIAKKSSPKQQKALTNKIKNLAEAEQSRLFLFSGLSLILFISTLMILIF